MSEYQDKLDRMLARHEREKAEFERSMATLRELGRQMYEDVMQHSTMKQLQRDILANALRHGDTLEVQ